MCGHRSSRTTLHQRSPGLYEHVRQDVPYVLPQPLWLAIYPRGILNDILNHGTGRFWKKKGVILHLFSVTHFAFHVSRDYTFWNFVSREEIHRTNLSQSSESLFLKGHPNFGDHRLSFQKAVLGLPFHSRIGYLLRRSIGSCSTILSSSGARP